MKTLYILIISLMCSALLQAQYLAKVDKQSISNLSIGEQQQIYKVDSRYYSYLGLNLGKHSVGDTSLYNAYGDLRDDDPAFRQKQTLWRPVVAITGDCIVTNLFDTYVVGEDFTHVGFASWGRNLKAGFPWGSGWEWDHDRFGMNFLAHPYGGGTFFIAARANGYNFWESAPFVLFGSYMWKIFGETGVPERNDLLATTVGGVFFGEIFYRLGSNVLDDRTTGWERFGRELAAAVLSPTRTWARFTEGKLFRVTSEEVYQTEPLNVTLSSGLRVVNNELSFLTGSTNLWLSVMLDYGNPFEFTSRKPFDCFNVSMDLTKGMGRKTLDYITGYGILFGKNYESGGLKMLIGGFQHWDYFDNWAFEMGTMAFGPGIISKLPISSNSNLYTNFHVGVVPFGANSTQLGPDTSQFRDYNFVGGAETKLESTLQLGSWVNVVFIGYYFWMHTYVGAPGDHYVGLIKPRIELKLFSNLSIGFEHQVYYSDRYTRDYGDYHKVLTEQRVFLSFLFENFKEQKE